MPTSAHPSKTPSDSSRQGFQGFGICPDARDRGNLAIERPVILDDLVAGLTHGCSGATLGLRNRWHYRTTHRCLTQSTGRSII